MLILGLAIAMILSACNNDTETDGEVIVETAFGEITKDEFYEELKARYGREVLDEMITRQVLESELDVDSDSVMEELDEELAEMEEQVGPQFLTLVQQQGFKTVEDYRRTLYLSKLEYDMATADITVTDEDIEEHYNRLQEEIHARHILVDELETAEEVLEKYNNGEDFEGLAEQYGTDGTASSGGSLGYFSAGHMIKPFEDAAYALEIGEISEPVETEFGWHVIYLEDRRPAENDVGELDEVRDYLRDQLIANQIDHEKAQSDVQSMLDGADIDVKIEEFNDLYN